MGKHSIAKAHKRNFNKTMAIALAAGVSLGGVQVVSAQAGHDVAGQAVAAEAGSLDKSVIKSHSVIADKSKAAITNACLLYTSPSPRDLSTSRMPSSA